MQGSLSVRRALNSHFTQLLLHYRLPSTVIEQKCNIHKQTVYEKLDIPPKPKRPIPPFLKFFMQIRPTLIKEFPQATFIDLSKIGADRWQIVDSKLKEKLEQQYQEELIQFTKLKHEYDRNLTPEQKAEIKRARQHSLDLKEKRKTNKKRKELGIPTMPPSSFLLYLHSRSTEHKKYSSYTEFVKAISADWNSLDPEVKSKLNAERQKDYEEYIKELKDWEEKMLKEGHLDVVRSSSLVSAPDRKQKK